MISWSPMLSIIVKGEPLPKQRPRWAKSIGRQYTPKQTIEFQGMVAKATNIQLDNLGRPDDELLIPRRWPVWVQMTLYHRRPKSLLSNKNPAGSIPHTRKPDIDNIAKAVLDGLDEAKRLWWDDGQVCDLSVKQRFVERGEEPRTEISILGASHA